ncbi:uncharacterized protein LOC100176574 [Ciona intestinalis]
MPPVTSNIVLRVYESQPKVEKKKPRSPKRTRKSPRNKRRNEQDVKLDTKEICNNRLTYSRDSLMAFRDSPTSRVVPSLPIIPGVTAPREPKQMPESLKLKLQKKGIIIKENIRPPTSQNGPLTSQVDSVTSQKDHSKQQKKPLTSQNTSHTLKLCSSNVTKPLCDTFNSCMLHVI